LLSDARGNQEILSIRRTELEMSSCVHRDSFTFRCTVSEDDIPLGILSKLRLRVAGIFSKPTRQGYERLRVCPSNVDTKGLTLELSDANHSDIGD
jgi:hypothetical protein